MIRTCVTLLSHRLATEHLWPLSQFRMASLGDEPSSRLILLYRPDAAYASRTRSSRFLPFLLHFSKRVGRRACCQLHLCRKPIILLSWYRILENYYNKKYQPKKIIGADTLHYHWILTNCHPIGRYIS